MSNLSKHSEAVNVFLSWVVGVCFVFFDWEHILCGVLLHPSQLFFFLGQLSVQYLFGQDLCVYLASSVYKTSAVRMASMQPILLIF